MQLERRDIKKGLSNKGFVEAESHHTYFHHEYGGKQTGIYTYLSHGAAYKTYQKALLSNMKRQLKLDSIRQVVDLCQCPMSHDEYNDILRAKGFITD